MLDYIIPEDELRQEASRDGITHLSTGVAIVRADKILAVRREISDFLGGVYELPGGGVDAGETLTDAIKREVLEETALSVIRILGMFPGFEYTMPEKPKVRQLNFLVEVTAGDIKLSGEHDAWRWVDKNNLAELDATIESKACFRAALVLIPPETVQ